MKLITGALFTLGLVAGSAWAQSTDMSHEAIAKRLAPVGELCLTGDDCGGAAGASKPAESGGSAQSGEKIYASVCTACHATGVAGAPKRGDAEAWSARLEKGMGTLYDHALNGFNAMPAKGGNTSLSDGDVKSAVNYLTEPVRGDDVEIDTGGDVAASGGGDEGAPAGGDANAVAASGDNENTASVDGAAIYGQVCTACHSTGVAGAPKRGDAEAWAPRLDKGMETLYSHALNGFNAMPAKGGNPALSDADVKAAVEHLVAPVE